MTNLQTHKNPSLGFLCKSILSESSSSSYLTLTPSNKTVTWTHTRTYTRFGLAYVFWYHRLYCYKVEFCRLFCYWFLYSSPQLSPTLTKLIPLTMKGISSSSNHCSSRSGSSSSQSSSSNSGSTS